MRAAEELLAMRKFVVAALLATTVSLGAIAYAQVKDEPVAGQGLQATPMESTPIQAGPMDETVGPAGPVQTADARSVASDQAVGEARRYYRAQCSRHESAAFCECVTAGVAQALQPAEVRIAANTIEDRITAQGDAAIASESDNSALPMSSADRIAQVEGHYADACASFRG
jgi:hypothetical protein